MDGNALDEKLVSKRERWEYCRDQPNRTPVAQISFLNWVFRVTPLHWLTTLSREDFNQITVSIWRRTTCRQLPRGQVCHRASMSTINNSSQLESIRVLSFLSLSLWSKLILVWIDAMNPLKLIVWYAFCCWSLA